MRSFDQYKARYAWRGPDVYWVVGVGLKVRHATEFRPGTFPAGEWVPTLCETWFRVPCATLYGQEPRSKAISARCPQCAECVGARSSAEWDF